MDEIEERCDTALDNAMTKLQAATNLRSTEMYQGIVSAPELVQHLLLSGILEVMLAQTGRTLNVQAN